MPIISLQSVGDKCPLFLLPPLGWHHAEYAEILHDLAQAFQPHRPVYCLVAPFGGDTKCWSLRESALAAVAELHSFFPNGPYQLAGHSNGGLVALAMASCLPRSEQSVSLLGLLDTYPVLASNDLDRIRNARKTNLKHWGRLLIHYLPSAERLVRPILPRLPSKHAAKLAVRAHVFETYEGATHVFSATLKGKSDQWNRFIRGKLTIVDIPGDHVSFLRNPHAVATAEIIKRYLLD